MWPAIIGAVGSIAGGLLSRGSKGQESSQQTAPWLAQQLDIAQRGSDLYGGDMRLPVWGGPYYAPAGSDTKASWDAIRSIAQGSPYFNAMWDYSRDLMGGNPFGDANLSQIGAPAQAGGMTPTTVGSTAQADRADTYWPTGNFLNMARDATQQVGGRSAGNAAQIGGYGTTASTAGPAGSARELAGQAPTAQTASASSNPYFGFNNPYTERAIADATRDMTRNFEQNTMPQLDRLMQQSGSFGNTGVQELQENAMSDFTRDTGDVANRMRMADLFAQQGMGEAAANRGTNVSQFNAGANNQMNALGYSTLAGLGQFDVGLGANLGMFNAGQLNDIGRFNAGLGQQGAMWNAGAMNDMARYNTGLGQQADLANQAAINNMQQFGLDAVNRGEQFNANLGTWNAGALNDMARWNAAAGNDAARTNTQVGMWNAGQTNDVAARNAAMANDMARYNMGMDWNAYMTGLGNMPWLQQNAILGGQLLGQIGGQQQGNEQGMINEDLRQWQDVAMNPYMNLNMYADLIGKLSGGFNMSGQQTYPGNPLIGALGGWQLGSAIGNNWGGGSLFPGYSGSPYGGFNTASGLYNSMQPYWGIDQNGYY